MVLVALFLVFVICWEIRFSRIADEQLKEQAAVIENDLWNLDSEGPFQYLQAAALLSDYERITVFAVDDHKPFIEIFGPKANFFETILLRTGLIFKKQLRSSIIHNGTVIGWLEVVRLHKTLYLYAYLFSVLGLFMLAAKYFLQTVKAKQTLEIAVYERTAELQKSREALSLILDTVPQSVFWKDLEGRYLGCNRVFAAAAGLDEPSSIVGKTDFDLPWPQKEAEAYRADDREVLQSNRPKLHIIEQVQLAGGRRVWVDTSKVPLRDAAGRPFALLGVYEDITERKLAEEEKARFEKQRLQSQKMEAVGQLAGGVAHDFNNMLSVINGYSEMLLGEIKDTSDPRYVRLNEIHKAGLRSAELTQQLLAFARKQVIAPKVLDLNDIIAGMLNMLKRLIGENIELEWKPDANLWRVKMDPSQINQILMNLLINARDAISAHGKIVIHTGNSELDEAFRMANPDSSAGRHVLLSICDNGCGIDKETIGHIFEPFFTTKKLGEGTGLGLATVFGIVKQNKGFINVYSEPGRGTTFNIYLPEYNTKDEKKDENPVLNEIPRGMETVLLVEDESSLLKLLKVQLENLGYNVLISGSPAQAIKIARESKGDIHLLMTDVVMPEMSGRDLEEEIKLIFPAIKCLFMSGYTADVIAKEGVLKGGMHYIQKPFTPGVLSAKLREALS